MFLHYQLRSLILATLTADQQFFIQHAIEKGWVGISALGQPEVTPKFYGDVFAAGGRQVDARAYADGIRDVGLSDDFAQRFYNLAQEQNITSVPFFRSVLLSTLAGSSADDIMARRVSRDQDFQTALFLGFNEKLTGQKVPEYVAQENEDLVKELAGLVKTAPVIAEVAKPETINEADQNTVTVPDKKAETPVAKADEKPKTESVNAVAANVTPINPELDEAARRQMKPGEVKEVVVEKQPAVVAAVETPTNTEAKPVKRGIVADVATAVKNDAKPAAEVDLVANAREAEFYRREREGFTNVNRADVPFMPQVSDTPTTVTNYDVPKNTVADPVTPLAPMQTEKLLDSLGITGDEKTRLAEQIKPPMMIDPAKATVVNLGALDPAKPPMTANERQDARDEAQLRAMGIDPTKPYVPPAKINEIKTAPVVAADLSGAKDAEQAALLQAQINANANPAAAKVITQDANKNVLDTLAREEAPRVSVADALKANAGELADAALVGGRTAVNAITEELNSVSKSPSYAGLRKQSADQILTANKEKLDAKKAVISSTTDASGKTLDYARMSNPSLNNVAPKMSPEDKLNLAVETVYAMENGGMSRDTIRKKMKTSTEELVNLTAPEGRKYTGLQLKDQVGQLSVNQMVMATDMGSANAAAFHVLNTMSAKTANLPVPPDGKAFNTLPVSEAIATIQHKDERGRQDPSLLPMSEALARASRRTGHSDNWMAKMITRSDRSMVENMKVKGININPDTATPGQIVEQVQARIDETQNKMELAMRSPNDSKLDVILEASDKQANPTETVRVKVDKQPDTRNPKEVAEANMLLADKEALLAPSLEHTGSIDKVQTPHDKREDADIARMEKQNKKPLDMSIARGGIKDQPWLKMAEERGDPTKYMNHYAPDKELGQDSSDNQRHANRIAGVEQKREAARSATYRSILNAEKASPYGLLPDKAADACTPAVEKIKLDANTVAAAAITKVAKTVDAIKAKALEIPADKVKEAYALAPLDSMNAAIETLHKLGYNKTDDAKLEAEMRHGAAEYVKLTRAKNEKLTPQQVQARIDDMSPAKLAQIREMGAARTAVFDTAAKIPGVAVPDLVEAIKNGTVPEGADPKKFEKVAAEMGRITKRTGLGEDWADKMIEKTDAVTTRLAKVGVEIDINKPAEAVKQFEKVAAGDAEKKLDKNQTTENKNKGLQNTAGM